MLAPATVSGAPVQKGFSAMNFRILAATVRPRGWFLALLAVTALAVPFALEAQAQAPAPVASAAPHGEPRADREATTPRPLPAMNDVRQLFSQQIGRAHV